MENKIKNKQTVQNKLTCILKCNMYIEPINTLEGDWDHGV